MKATWFTPKALLALVTLFLGYLAYIVDLRPKISAVGPNSVLLVDVAILVLTLLLVASVSRRKQ